MSLNHFIDLILILIDREIVVLIRNHVYTIVVFEIHGCIAVILIS